MDSTAQEKKELYDLLDFTDVKKQMILNTLITSDIFYESIDVSQDVYKDTSIDKWAEKLPTLSGSKLLINKLIHNATNSKEILLERQKTYGDYDIDFTIIEDYEDDVLWIYKLNQDIQANNLIHALFPSTFLVSYINYVEPLLEFYHIYKIYLTPINILLYPIITFFAPLYYVRNFLKFNVSIATYMKMLYNIIKMIFNYSGGIKAFLIKLISMSFYAFLFFYNIYQTFEYCYMLYDVKNTLYKRISNLNIFLKAAMNIINKVPKNIIKPFIKIPELSDFNSLVFNNSMTSVYKLWKNQTLKDNISKLLLSIYAIDIIHSVTTLTKRNNWSLSEYKDTEVSEHRTLESGILGNVKMWNMKNPVLHHRQTGNPMDLSRNIVITGPNAAGKTTYVKSILSNIILSQTFGICYAIKAETVLYDSIVSFMRISDVLGSKSYFEVEAEYCREMMMKANTLSQNNMRGLFLMDEPMHSTPPTEGMATAFAVAEYIGNLPGANIILTTHFHKLTLLQNMYPDKFINLSVEAIPQEKGFFFPYTIKKGHSYQCIAIELLSSKDFPPSVIESAINMKNKIYNEINK